MGGQIDIEGRVRKKTLKLGRQQVTRGLKIIKGTDKKQQTTF